MVIETPCNSHKAKINSLPNLSNLSLWVSTNLKVTPLNATWYHTPLLVKRQCCLSLVPRGVRAIMTGTSTAATMPAAKPLLYKLSPERALPAVRAAED